MKTGRLALVGRSASASGHDRTKQEIQQLRHDSIGPQARRRLAIS
jgi:hypothetical protein